MTIKIGIKFQECIVLVKNPNKFKFKNHIY